MTGFGRRVASGVGTLALLAAVVVSTGVIGEQRLSTDERYREFTVTGETGTWVSTDTFHVEVRSTQAAGVVADQSGWQYQTSGVWLLVEVRLVARTEPTTIGYAAVRDDRGRTWRATDRLEQPLLHWSYPLQPGLPVAATLVFEVPTDAASSLTLRLSKRADPRAGGGPTRGDPGDAAGPVAALCPVRRSGVDAGLIPHHRPIDRRGQEADQQHIADRPVALL